MRKTTFIFNLSSFIFLVAAFYAPAADTALAPLPKMTSAEAAETVLAEGVAVRITDTTPADVRVGDGVTAGGVRVGDGIGWEEGTALTQDLNTGGHSINLGQGFELKALGGWTALSGPGVLSTDNSKFYLSAYGSILMEAFSDVASLNLDIACDGTYINLTTPLGETQPTIEYTTNLLTSAWASAPIAGIVTNADTYVFNISPTNFTAYAFFRAVIPTGSGSIVDFSATLKQNGEPVALASDLAGYATTGAVYSVILNGTTNFPTSGTVDLGTISGGGLAGTNEFYYFSAAAYGTNYIAAVKWDATNKVFTVMEPAE